MRTIIAKEKLTAHLESHDSLIKSYSAELSDCELPKESKETISSLEQEIRDIFRSEQNLQEACEFIETLELALKEDRYGLNISNRALFISAVMLYGACFVKGGQGRKIPLINLKDIYENEEIHNYIMLYRHKLIGHLDEDHDVRTDTLKWDFRTEGEYLKPTFPHLSGSKVMMEMGHKNLVWLEHMKKIILEINKRRFEITLQVNGLLGDVEIAVNP